MPIRMQKIWHAAGYLGMAAIPAISNFAIVVVLVRLLPASEFAAWAVIEPTLIIFGASATLGSHFGLLNLIARQAVSATTGFVNVAVVVLATIFIVAPILGFVFYYTLGRSLFLMLFLILASDALAATAVNCLRGQRKPFSVVGFELIRSAGPATILWAGYLWNPAIFGSVEAVLLLRGCCTAIGVVAIIGKIGISRDVRTSVMREQIRYGFPLLIASSMSLFMMNGDRYIMAFFSIDPLEMASYVAHQRVAGLLSIAMVTPLNIWFPVEAMRRDANTDGNFFRRVLILVTSSVSILVLIAVAVAPVVWHTAFPSITFDGRLFVLLVAAIVPQSLAIVFNIGGLRTGFTHWNISVSLVASLAMYACGVPLTLMFGLYGTALARIAAFLSYALAFRFISQRIVPIALPFAAASPFLVAVVLSMAAFWTATGLGTIYWLAAAALSIIGGLVFSRGWLTGRTAR